MLDRMELVEKPKDTQKSISIKFRKSLISSNDVLFVENLSKSYGDKEIFSHISFNLYKNEKAFLLGPNGCGKSTLLKSISGILEKNSGVIELGHNISIGYYDQEMSSLNPDNRIIDEIFDDFSEEHQTLLRSTLAAFRFSEEDVQKKISVLSGGEKSRVLLCKLVLSNANFLILDEPTNHLDIASREVLEKALKEYPGTILAVSHDRYFYNKLANRILYMDGKGLFNVNGDYEAYLKFKKSSLSQDDQSSDRDVSKGKLEYMEKKQQLANQRKMEKRMTEVNARISFLEEELKKIEIEMLKPEIANNHELLYQLYNTKEDYETELLDLYDELS